MLLLSRFVAFLHMGNDDPFWLFVFSSMGLHFREQSSYDLWRTPKRKPIWAWIHWFVTQTLCSTLCSNNFYTLGFLKVRSLFWYFLSQIDCISNVSQQEISPMYPSQVVRSLVITTLLCCLRCLRRWQRKCRHPVRRWGGHDLEDSWEDMTKHSMYVVFAWFAYL